MVNSINFNTISTIIKEMKNHFKDENTTNCMKNKTKCTFQKEIIFWENNTKCDFAKRKVRFRNIFIHMNRKIPQKKGKYSPK